MMNLACAMAQKSGTTGPLSWNYNETSKELTITGDGAMPNYDYGAAPVSYTHLDVYKRQAIFSLLYI